MQSPVGWYATAIAVSSLIAVVVRQSRNGSLADLARRTPLRTRIFILLGACAVVPTLTELMVEGGRTAGWYSRGTVVFLHAVAATVFLVIIALEVGSSMQRMEASARQTEARLRLQIDRMPIAYMTVAPDFTITEWSPAAARIFGWSESEIVGRSASVLLPDARTSAEVEILWLQLLKGDFPAHNINQNVTKDERIITCRWYDTPVPDASGKIISVICMAEDITEEQKSQNALRESQQRYRTLVDSLPHYVFSVDNDDCFVAVNKALCEYFGHPESEIIGRTPRELGLPEDVASARAEQKEKTRSTGKVQMADTEFYIAGHQRKARTITSPLRDASGAIVGVTGITIDVTEQRDAETAMQTLLAAVEQLEEVLFVTDREGVITYANPAFEKVYGFTRDEALGKTPRILKSGEISQERYAHFWSEILAGRSVHGEYRNRTKDGMLVDVIGSASPIFDGGGQITGFVAVQQNVTQQKRAAEERRELDDRLGRLAKMEALGTLAGGMAHDFNNILAIILTHTTLLERRTADAARVTSAVATIKQAVQRGAGLSRQILTFARRAEIKAERVDVAKLTMELTSMISETFPRTVQVTLDLDPDLPPLTADSGQIHQALLNLCVNARDAMPQGGELRVESRLLPAAAMRALSQDALENDYICIAVRDSGVGMDDETRRHMFEPFFTTKPKGKGTGLGLALVYGVVKAHDGLIDVTSSVGRGTTFRLYFPVAALPIVPAPVTQAPAALKGHETVLVIDDELPIVEGLKEGLTLRGYRVFTASDGPEAIETCIRMPHPDAIVMDLGMPKMQASTLVTRLLEIVPGVPVVAMTGYLDPDASIVQRSSVRRILQKPFEVDELHRVLSEILAEPVATPR